MSKSQKDILLEAFKRGDELTANSAMLKLSVGTFSQRVNDIERMGFKVSRAWFTSFTGKRYMKYWINQCEFIKVDKVIYMM